MFGFEDGILFNSLGLAGAVLYILAYAGIQTGILRGATMSFTLINMVAASLVLLSLSHNFNMSAALIQVTWLLISAVGIARILILQRISRLNPEEADLVERKLPAMSRPMARKLLDAGHWRDVPQGAQLAREGEILGKLIYLARGSATASLGGSQIGHVPKGNFIGEMTCLDGGDATATITAAEPARCFEIASQALRHLCDRDSDLKVMLEGALGRDTRAKLIAANQKMSLAKLA